ncbi:MAG: hypothetical protein HOK65_02580, partial [Crocinitomicaceae bacterium]|nr:hypothetical protein [Crocinitomicaceae bacterium]
GSSYNTKLHFSTAVGTTNANTTAVEVMTLDSAGNVGIGTTSPGYPLHVKNYNSYSFGSGSPFWGSNIRFRLISGGGSAITDNDGITYPYAVHWADYASGASGSYLSDTADMGTAWRYGSVYVGARIEWGIWTDKYVLISSDERIKENIRDVSDNAALQKLRDISCCFYEYKDKIGSGFHTTIGFIAQQVRKHMPMAVSLQKGIIPNELRIIENPQWTTMTNASGNNTYKLTIPDLEDVSGNTKYKFYVCNDPSGNDECKKEIFSLEDDPKSFIFEKQWLIVMLHGKEVDDFHTLDKMKLFSLNFSASQEIDRIQQAEKAKLEEQTSKLEAAEAEIIALKSKNQDLETKLEEQTSKLIVAENKLEEQTTKLEEQTTKLTNLIDQLKANNTIN